MPFEGKHLNRKNVFSFWGCDRYMREKIIKEAMEWYNGQEKNPKMEEFIDLVINKTAESFIEHLQTEFEQEFSQGNLKHPFFISNEYYLELKLKDVKNKYLQSRQFKDSPSESV